MDIVTLVFLVIGIITRIEVEALKQTRNYTISRCVCTNCGLIFPIPRKKSAAREKGHIKDIWCPSCKEISKFFEIRDCDFENCVMEVTVNGTKRTPCLG